MNDEEVSNNFFAVSKKLSESVSKLKFDADCLIYNPLDYASSVNEIYIKKYLKYNIKAIFLGMNPGPFGMAQTGVPFGDVLMVKDWLNISGKVSRPKVEHPKRPILGFDCKRKEVSGTRLWGWAKDRYKDPDKFFSDFFVWNYCPLVFMEPSGANKTPDKLSIEHRKFLFEPCNLALRELVKISNAKLVIGVGKFARKRAEESVGDIVKVGDILHPSPASPKANKNWVGEIEKQLEGYGVLKS